MEKLTDLSGKCNDTTEEIKSSCNMEPGWYQDYLRLRFSHLKLETICMNSTLFFETLLEKQTEEGIWNLHVDLSAVKEILTISERDQEPISDIKNIVKHCLFCQRDSVYFPKLFRSCPPIDYTKTICVHIVLFTGELNLSNPLLTYSLFIREKEKEEILHIPITWLLGEITEDQAITLSKSREVTCHVPVSLNFTALEKDKDLVKCVMNRLVPNVIIDWNEHRDKPLFFPKGSKITQGKNKTIQSRSRIEVELD